MLQPPPPENLNDARILAITNGVMGSDAQVLGVAAALGVKIEIRHAKVSGVRGLFAPFLPASPQDVGVKGRLLSPPWPDVLISVGRKATPIVVSARVRSAGRCFTMALQHPRVPTSAYDLIWAPEHDRLSGANVISTLTSPHRITPTALDQARQQFGHLAVVDGKPAGPLLAVLIGGPNGVFPFPASEAQDLCARLDRLIADAEQAGPAPRILISFSRRTTAEIRAVIETWAAARRAWVWDETGPNPYVGLVALADAVIVTFDSVNMAGEAASTGKPVLVFPLTGKGAKFAAFHAALAKTGATRPLEGAFRPWSYPPVDHNPVIASRLAAAYDEWRQKWL
jgi:mitochondrial fission protein ELM1